MDKKKLKIVKPISIKKKVSPQRQRQKKHVEKLIELQSNINIVNNDYDINLDNKDLIKSIDYLLSIQWEIIPTVLEFGFKNHLDKFRNFIPKIIIKSQLYSIHLNNQTFVDQELEKLIQKRLIFKLIIDEENDELIIKTNDYMKFIEQQEQIQSIESYKQFALQNFKDIFFKYVLNINSNIMMTNLIKINNQELESKFNCNKLQIDYLLKEGYLKIIPLINDQYLQLSIPRFGFILKLLKQSKILILKSLKLTKYNELLMNQLIEKWNTNKSKYKDFKGLNIYFILHYLIGKGLIESFETQNQSKAIKLV
ncbi:hypothetical protein WICMUC_005643 [Wickerhamomyces mucosus]|uniref:Uncharacterized protein n=1 Tax=Wickerhamomyces mucosus TaxID=1378264 RepID=A0A9P8T5R0_9ASCO|nr:hypothetical protein WICMUC_005643 [Wickerhamomyces mucosus]